MIEIRPEAVQEAINSLNKGKVADSEGILAEHLSTALPRVSTHLSIVLTKAVNEGIPDIMKADRKISIPKKGKSPILWENHRGITITSSQGKALDHVVLKGVSPLSQSEMQFGFTKDLSPTMAALCLTEALAVASTLGKELKIATLDVEKTFIMVNHNILLQSLYIAGYPLQWWHIIKDLYTNPKEYLEWQGCESNSYMVRLGVRQAGILSTYLYKTYNNKLLEELEREGNGLHIGTTFMEAPTCADDMLHLTIGDDRLQAMIFNSDQYSDQRRYIIHPIKSESTSSGQPAKVSLKSKQLPQVDSVKHLGLSQNPKSNSEAVEERLE